MKATPDSSRCSSRCPSLRLCATGRIWDRETAPPPRRACSGHGRRKARRFSGRPLSAPGFGGPGRQPGQGLPARQGREGRGHPQGLRLWRPARSSGASPTTRRGASPRRSRTMPTVDGDLRLHLRSAGRPVRHRRQHAQARLAQERLDGLRRRGESARDADAAARRMRGACSPVPQAARPPRPLEGRRALRAVVAPRAACPRTPERQPGGPGLGGAPGSQLPTWAIDAEPADLSGTS